MTPSEKNLKRADELIRIWVNEDPCMPESLVKQIANLLDEAEPQWPSDVEIYKAGVEFRIDRELHGYSSESRASDMHLGFYEGVQWFMERLGK